MRIRTEIKLNRSTEMVGLFLALIDDEIRNYINGGKDEKVIVNETFIEKIKNSPVKPDILTKTVTSHSRFLDNKYCKSLRPNIANHSDQILQITPTRYCKSL